MANMSDILVSATGIFQRFFKQCIFSNLKTFRVRLLSFCHGYLCSLAIRMYPMSKDTLYFPVTIKPQTLLVQAFLTESVGFSYEQVRRFWSRHVNATTGLTGFLE
jgi:hypothetical protein